MDAFGSLLVGLFGALIAWRTAAGALAVKEVGETSAILGWPVWIAQGLMVPGFVMLARRWFLHCSCCNVRDGGARPDAKGAPGMSGTGSASSSSA